MNLSHALNEMITYIEEHLTENISYTKLAQFLGINEYTMQSLFSLLCQVSLSDYIRKRRLSEAGSYLYQRNSKIIDVALLYHYENPTSFSRAFEKFHGIKPSQVKNKPEKLKLYPKLHFDETITKKTDNIEYSIIEQEELILYGKGFKTTKETISQEAPIFFRKMYDAYSPKYGEIDYGMTVYEDRWESHNFEYWILYQKEIPGFTKYIIPKSKWLCFHIPTFQSDSVQEMTQKFYLSFLPSCNYNIRPIPELEYYHDDVTDLLIPIED